MSFGDFLFPRTSDKWLAILRIGIGVQVVSYCVSLWPDWNLIFGQGANGLISRDLTEAIVAMDSTLLPRLSWVVSLANYFHLAESAVLAISLYALFASGCLLIAGIFCRLAAIVAWFLHVAANTSAGLMTYGVDNFITICLFYLMVSPLPDRFSLDWRLRHRRPSDPQLLGFFQRILQLHLCVIYFFGGLDKCLGSGWWNGDNIWRALIRPPFNIISPQLILRWNLFLPAIGMLICLIEIGYPIFIWLKRTRAIWLTAVLVMHAGIAVAMGLYQFAWVMIVLNLAAFGSELIFREGRLEESICTPDEVWAA
jgi:Vitamin K-dependent gamma-carboxylase